ncbi:UDP-N-acetylmuramoyl-tripeptide--D-alanyl-D-alanine ligase [Kiritimatiellota bacterium B12222]|nr:UDP-N-acetylmuramoyl-tripeptide--D-alanyl-D-alanine ligase [Kiritimatiellota bacterium B12222]
MPSLSPAHLAEWTQGTWTCEPHQLIQSVCQDTRHIQSGALYVALHGERVDGHDYFPQARAAGAVASLGLKGRGGAELPCLEVEDVGQALMAISKGYREVLTPRKMIGVTGSAGKTTIKDLITSMLSQAGPTCSTKGNWNNFVGLPLSLLAMEDSDVFGVFELGMNQVGEIAALTEILKPEVGLISSIGEAHLEHLGTVSAIAEEKGSLLARLPVDGVAILDRDTPWYPALRGRCLCGCLSVSLKEDADYRGTLREEGLQIDDAQREERFVVPLPLPGDHMVTNVLQAVAVARECGLSAEEIIAGLRAYTSAPMRWQCGDLREWSFINDAYNANPLSMRKSIETFASLVHEGEKWLVLGGMGELGEEAQALHGQLGHELDKHGFDGVVLVGEKAAWIGEGILQTRTLYANTHAQAAETIVSDVPSGAHLLLKGSRSEAVEKILQILEKPKEKIL